MVPNTFAKWERGKVQGDGRLADFQIVKARIPIAFFNKRTEAISGGVRVRLADAKMIVDSDIMTDVKEGDRFTVDQNGKRYKVESAESAAFGMGYRWFCALLRLPDDADGK